MVSTEGVVETSLQGRVGIIRLVNEHGRNAMIQAWRDGMAAAVAQMVEDPDVRAIYLTGRGKAFCAGGDLSMMQRESDPWSAYQRLSGTNRWLMDLIRCPKPVVVGVNGVAVGGGVGIAITGDVVYAAESARFMSGFMRLGLMPDLGILHTLPRLVGMAKAKAFLLGNETWTAQQAEAAGLIAGVVPDAELDARCMERAAAMAAGPIEALGMAKQILGRTYETALDELLTYESLGQPIAYATQSMREGLAALIEKREPDFVAASERELPTQAARRRRGQ